MRAQPLLNHIGYQRAAFALSQQMRIRLGQRTRQPGSLNRAA